ncbi:MAG TPA: D-aminoacylase, partial [Luteimonas sp.]
MQRMTPALLALALAACGTNPVADAPTTVERYDLLVRNGTVYDGSGAAPRRVDVAVRGDRIAALLPPDSEAAADQVLDAGGRAVAPGFINVLSWATESLIADGRGMGDTKQGVTLEIFGEGWSMGPLNDAMKADALKQQGDI